MKGPRQRETALPSGAGRRQGATDAGPEPQVLRRGTWKKPEVRLTRRGGHLAVQKDYRRSAALLRPWFRWAWRHEARIYKVLQEARITPRLMQSHDGLLVLEYVEGLPISRLDGSRRGPRAVQALEQAVEEMHRRGVFHLDLRKRDNVLVTPDDQVHLVDFGSAVLLRWPRWLRWLLAPGLGFFDRYAVLKWKSWLDPQALTREDRRLLVWLDRMRGRRGRLRPAP